MKKLLLINPAERHAGLGAHKTSSMTPIALAYIAALTPPHYRIEVVDENIEQLNFPSADIVGITSYTAHIRRAYEIAEFYRQKSIPVIMGGIHASMLPDEALKYCDSIVIGEAESVWRHVLEDFEKGDLKFKYFGEQLPLEQLPFPNRSVLRNDKYLWGSIQTSRGCPMNCSFCSVTKFNGNKFRRRPVGDVIAELAEIQNRFILILDDNILGYDDHEWLYAFFTAIINKKIKKLFFTQTSLKFGEDKNLVKLAHKAGLRVVLVGIESVDPNSLKIYNKKLNAAYAESNKYLQLISNIRSGGVNVLGCFILGCDADSISTFQTTLNFIFKARIDCLQLTKPTPLPGTQFYAELDGEKRIIDKNYPDAWQHYRFTRMLFKPKKLDISDVYEGFYYIKRNFYSWPAKLRRAFFTLLDTKSLSSLWVSMILNRSYEKAFFSSEIYNEFDMAVLKRKFKAKHKQ
jgi:radical SAM superfamily enzyme YgiQ (UPF0313 family)